MIAGHGTRSWQERQLTLFVHDPFRNGQARRQTLLKWTVCAAIVLASSGVVTSQALGATVVVTSPCVVNSNPSHGSGMRVKGAGFAPGSIVKIRPNAQSLSTGGAVAKGNGTFAATFRAPTLATRGPGVSTFGLAAYSSSGGTAATTYLVANLAVASTPTVPQPGQELAYSFSGFVSGAKIYAHYLHGNMVTATTTFGTTSGPCGTLHTTVPRYPGENTYHGYTVQFDDSPQYSTKSRPKVVTTLLLPGF
jgi:hypothetical protein